MFQFNLGASRIIIERKGNQVFMRLKWTIQNFIFSLLIFILGIVLLLNWVIYDDFITNMLFTCIGLFIIYFGVVRSSQYISYILKVDHKGNVWCKNNLKNYFICPVQEIEEKLEVKYRNKNVGPFSNAMKLAQFYLTTPEGYELVLLEQGTAITEFEIGVKQFIKEVKNLQIVYETKK